MNDLTVLPRHRALAILWECSGDHVWSVEHCRQRGLPDDWIQRFAEAHESGFQREDQKLYVDGSGDRLRMTNQYFGVHDLKLALEIGAALGVDVSDLAERIPGRHRVVEAIKHAVEEG